MQRSVQQKHLVQQTHPVQSQLLTRAMHGLQRQVHSTKCKSPVLCLSEGLPCDWMAELSAQLQPQQGSPHLQQVTTPKPVSRSAVHPIIMVVTACDYNTVMPAICICKASAKDADAQSILCLSPAILI